MVLAALSMILAGLAVLYSVHYATALQASQRQQDARQAADQRAQSAVFERKLCTTLNALAALRPPPGSPGDNPSRAYLLQQHQVLAELGPDVGCGR